MRDIFQELYNKVLSLFNSSKEEIDPTKSIAINRLKTVLMQDRAGFSERAIQMLKDELIAVISKYMEIEDEDFELEIDAKEDGKTVLTLSAPVIRAKTDDEIDEKIKEQELKTQKKAQEIVKELENLIKENTQALIDGKIDPSLLEEAARKANSSQDDEESAVQKQDDAAESEADSSSSQEEEMSEENKTDNSENKQPLEKEKTKEVKKDETSKELEI